jgi:hypothetical protein
MWEDDDPLRERNVRDQATFNVFMREAEMKKDPMGDLPLSGPCVCKLPRCLPV